MLNNEDFTNELDTDEAMILELTDEEGTVREFEFLDSLEMDKKEYVALIENTEDADEVVFLEVESLDDETENYLVVDDEATGIKLYEMFKEAHKGEFEFED